MTSHNETPTYPWYGLVNDDSLEQGDFLFSCPVLEPIPPTKGTLNPEDQLSADVREYDVVVLSQSCDLANDKVQTVLVCPHWTIDVLSEIDYIDAHFRTNKGLEDIRRGNTPGLHLLNACDLPEFNSTVRVVSFRQVFGLPINYVRRLAESQLPRLRLLPPYREHLAQAFARFVMRVGLPVDIPPFRTK